MGIPIAEYMDFEAIWRRHLKPYAAHFRDDIFPTNANPSLETVIHLFEWPESSRSTAPGAKRRFLHILVHARERFSAMKPYRIVESKIKVTYLRVDTQQIATPLSTVHYDYDQDLRPGHPVYHFHCSSDPISEDLFPPSFRYKTLNPQSTGWCFPFRVPTPHMCLCSVLIGLVADHLPPVQFKKLWTAIKEKGWIPPLAQRCELWSLGQAGADPRALHSWQWYFWPECNC